MDAPAILTCPICCASLAPTGKTLRCPRGHAFDVTREGYVNLLARRRSGDTREMLVARRAFLERGHYDALSDAIGDVVVSHVGAIPAGARRRGYLLDSGCGEGYHLGRLMRRLGPLVARGRGSYVGIDSSKEAARLAARRYPAACFAVADVWDRIPVADHSLDVLLDVFAPRNPAEFARVVRPGGLLVIAIPGPSHLLELRQALPLLGIQEGKEDHIREQFTGAFTLQSTPRLSYRLSLQADDVRSLIQMTPNAFHAGRHLDPPGVGEQIDTRVDFALLVFLRSVGHAHRH